MITVFKHRFVAIPLLVGFMGMLSACSSSEEQVTNPETEVASGKNSIEGMSEDTLDLSAYPLNDEEMSEFTYNYGAAVDDGYYFIATDILYFYDMNSEMCVPVCNRPNCTHDNSDCTAYLIGTADTSYESNNVIYEDGYLYTTLADTAEGEVKLCQIAADGSARNDDYMTLYRIAKEGESGTYSFGYPEFCIHRGYVYFTYMDEAVPKIRRMELGSDKTEVIYETSGIRPSLYRFRFNGDYLFFQSGNFTDDSCLEIEGGVFAYNTVNGEIRFIKNGAISYYTISNDNLYYYDYEDMSICQKSLSDGSEYVILENFENIPFRVVGDVIYIWDEISTLTAYDLKGSELVSITDGNIEDCFFGDKRNFIGYASEEDPGRGNKRVMHLLNLDEFLQGDGAWDKIN